MTRPTTPDTTNPALDTAANQGQVNTQGGKGAATRHDGNKTDQSEGARSDGQATANHGQGAGFSRNAH